MSVGELSSLLDLLSSVLLLPPSLSAAFWLSVSDMASALRRQNHRVSVRTGRSGTGQRTGRQLTGQYVC